jgi:hypothetical protein
MCDLMDEPCALVSGPRKSQQGESLGMQLGELTNLIVMFIYVTNIHYPVTIIIDISAHSFICHHRYVISAIYSAFH